MSLTIAKLTNDGSMRAPYGTIGNAIRTLRLKNGWTQRQLGKRIGRTQGGIAHYESGRTCPSTQAVQLLAIEFNVPIELILAHRRSVLSQ